MQYSHDNAELKLLACALHAPEIVTKLSYVDAAMFAPDRGAVWDKITQGGDPAEAAITAGMYEDIMAVEHDLTHAQSYADVLVKYTYARQQQALLALGSKALEDGDLQLWQQLYDRMGEAAPNKSASEGFGAALAATLGRFHSGIMTLQSGLPGFDKYTGGLPIGNLSLLVGRSGLGKTAAAIQIIDHALSNGRKVLFFQQEMSRESTIARLVLRSVKDITYLSILRKLAFGDDVSADLAAFGAAGAGLVERWGDRLQLVFGQVSLQRMLVEVMQHKPDLVVVDHTGLTEEVFQAGSTGNVVHALGNVTMGLKNMAKANDCAVLALHQLRKGAMESSDRPTIADVRDSGKVIENSDLIFCVHRPNFAMGNTDDPAAEMLIFKMRDGIANGLVPMVFDGETQTFSKTQVYNLTDMTNQNNNTPTQARLA